MKAKAARAKVDPDATIAAMASMVRALYVASYRFDKLAREGVESDWGDRPIARWDGGDSGTGTHTPVWPVIARLCLDRQLDPASFIEAQFAGAEKAPWPNQMTGEHAVAKYRRSVGLIQTRIRLSLPNQERSYRLEAQCRAVESDGELTLDQARELVLRDSSFGLSAIFRYCAAVRDRGAALAALFRDAALFQYIFQRAAYDSTWGAMIPEDLRSEADALLKSFG